MELVVGEAELNTLDMTDWQTVVTSLFRVMGCFCYFL